MSTDQFVPAVAEAAPVSAAMATAPRTANLANSWSVVQTAGDATSAEVAGQALPGGWPVGLDEGLGCDRRA